MCDSHASARRRTHPWNQGIPGWVLPLVAGPRA